MVSQTSEAAAGISTAVCNQVLPTIQVRMPSYWHNRRYRQSWSFQRGHLLQATRASLVSQFHHQSQHVPPLASSRYEPGQSYNIVPSSAWTCPDQAQGPVTPCGNLRMSVVFRCLDVNFTLLVLWHCGPVVSELQAKVTLAVPFQWPGISRQAPEGTCHAAGGRYAPCRQSAAPRQNRKPWATPQLPRSP